VLQGPQVNAQYPDFVGSIAASGKAVGTHWVDGVGPTAYQWNPSVAVNSLTFSDGAVFIDDRDTIYYDGLNAFFPNIRVIDATPLPPHLDIAESPLIIAWSHSGFVALCDDSGAKPPSLRQVYDGRAWDLSAGALVSPASGFSFRVQPTGCFYPASNTGAINRQGHILGTALRNGVETPVILTPRGVALP
jgi:hypothetical protein